MIYILVYNFKLQLLYQSKYIIGKVTINVIKGTLSLKEKIIIIVVGIIIIRNGMSMKKSIEKESKYALLIFIKLFTKLL
ncbi:MAG: hypothetical protein H7Y18_17720 [Clostridiaceae bacterium]|nr:hypothetical protein [Clostridiaceae bacterium]